jgi:hypothetical protein
VVPFETPIAVAVSRLSSAGGQEGSTGLESDDGPASFRSNTSKPMQRIYTGRILAP